MNKLKFEINFVLIKFLIKKINYWLIIKCIDKLIAFKNLNIQNVLTVNKVFMNDMIIKISIEYKAL